MISIRLSILLKLTYFSNFRIPSCSYRFGTMLSSGCLKTKAGPTKAPTKAGPTKAPTLCSGRFGICRKISKPKVRRTPTRRYPSCSLRVGCIHRPTPRKPRTRQPATTSAPKVRIITPKPPAKTTSPQKNSSCKKVKENCYGKFSLLEDISNCGEHWKVTLPKPKSRARVFVKKVIEMQVVELPMGQCGIISSKGYDETTIKCLNCKGIKTSMSGKKDRVMHSGVIVKTEDGSKYLIHKSKDSKGVKGTVIEEPNDAMYDKGYRNVGDPIEPKKLRSIRKYFKASGNGYNFMTDNCHDGTERMIKLANKP